MGRRILGGVGLVTIAFALTLISWKPTEKQIAPYAFTSSDSTNNESFKSIYDSTGLSETRLAMFFLKKL